MKHRRYGYLRAVAALAGQILRTIARQIRSSWRQAEIRVGHNVRIASNVVVSGTGRIIIENNVRIARGVTIVAHRQSTIQIGADSNIAGDAYIEAREGQILRIGPRFNMHARAALVSVGGIVWGSDCQLGPDSAVHPREAIGAGSLTVGDRCLFAGFNVIDLSGDVFIGDDTHLGSHCAIYTHNHVPKPGKLIWEQEPSVKPVAIGDGTWLGHNCLILPGVTVGSGAIIAGGGVVTRAVPDGAVVGGSPARLLRQQAPDHFSEAKHDR